MHIIGAPPAEYQRFAKEHMAASSTGRHAAHYLELPDGRRLLIPSFVRLPDGRVREVPPSELVQVARHLRKLGRVNGFVAKKRVVRTRYLIERGETRQYSRRVNRRIEFMAKRSRGFLVVNDGVESGNELVRLLRYLGYAEQADQIDRRLDD